MLKVITNNSANDVPMLASGVYVAFYNAGQGKPMDWLIALAQLSEFSHCELVFVHGDQEERKEHKEHRYESFGASFRDDRECRFRMIAYDPAKWVFVPVHVDFSDAWHECRLLQGKPYDLLGAALCLFGAPFRAEHAFFCSELIYYVLDRLGYVSAWMNRRVGSAKRISPKKLFTLLQEGRLCPTNKNQICLDQEPMHMPSAIMQMAKSRLQLQTARTLAKH